MPDPAIPQPRLWRMALICLLLLYEAGKQDAAARRRSKLLADSGLLKKPRVLQRD